MIDLVLSNSADPDEMPHYVAFHLSLHCLRKSTRLGVSSLQRVQVTCQEKLSVLVQALHEQEIINSNV